MYILKAFCPIVIIHGRLYRDVHGLFDKNNTQLVMNSKLPKKRKKPAVAFIFDLLQNQNYQIIFVFKRVSVMLIKKSR